MPSAEAQGGAIGEKPPCPSGCVATGERHNISVPQLPHLGRESIIPHSAFSVTLQGENEYLEPCQPKPGVSDSCLVISLWWDY